VQIGAKSDVPAKLVTTGAAAGAAHDVSHAAAGAATPAAAADSFYGGQAASGHSAYSNGHMPSAAQAAAPSYTSMYQVCFLRQTPAPFRASHRVLGAASAPVVAVAGLRH